MRLYNRLILLIAFLGLVACQKELSEKIPRHFTSDVAPSESVETSPDSPTPETPPFVSNIKTSTLGWDAKTIVGSERIDIIPIE